MAGEFDGGNLSTGRFFPASNCSGSFKPVHSGHLYVHEDKIEMLAFERFQRRGAVVRRNDSVTLFSGTGWARLPFTGFSSTNKTSSARLIFCWASDPTGSRRPPARGRTPDAARSATS